MTKINKMPNPLFVFFFALSMLLPMDQARAACGLSLTASDVNISWSLNFTSIAVSVIVNRSTTDACSYALGFTKGNGASYVNRRAASGGNLLRYQLYKDSGLTKTLKDDADVVSIDEVIDGGFPAGASPSQTVNYYLEVPFNLATTPVMVSSGTYTDTFLINVYEASAPPYSNPVASKSITLTVTVPPLIALSLVDSGGSFQLGHLSKNVDFGMLSEGASASMDLRVRTNAGFSVTFSSNNNGKMKHTTPGRNSLVPYTFYVNGATMDLSNSKLVPVVGLSGGGSTGMSGLAFPLKVVIGSVTGPTVLGGPHSDDITITATTTE
jgi:spore coat protein U-like protein